MAWSSSVKMGYSQVHGDYIAHRALGRDVVNDELLVNDLVMQPYESDRDVFVSTAVAALPR